MGQGHLKLGNCHANDSPFLHRQHIFLDPNAKDPLNKEAADELKNNRELFKRNVRTAMGGGKIVNRAKEEVTYTKVLP